MILHLTGEFVRLVSQRRRVRSRSGASYPISFNTHVFSESVSITGLIYPFSLLPIASDIEFADLGDVPTSRSHDDIHRLNRKPAGPSHLHRFQPQFFGRIDEFWLGRLNEAGDNVDEISKIFRLFLALE